MKVLRTEVVKLDSIQANLFVRQRLDEDHVLFLAGLYQGGTKFDPIEVNESLAIADGRHRKGMYELCDIKEVEVKILRFADEAEMIAYAFRANAGGAKPPTTADVTHTIELLLEHGQSIKMIGESLGLPPVMIRKYASEVKSRLARKKLVTAAEAVTDGGLTVSKAAEQYDVDLDKLKEYLSSRRKKHKNGVEELHRQLTFNYKSVSSKNAAYFRRLTEQFDDGDVTKKQVVKIIDHLEKLQKQSGRALADWKARFEAKFSEGKTKEDSDKLAKTA